MFHKSNLGSFGTRLPCDRDGYVPEAGDSLEDFNFGGEFDDDDDLWEAFVAMAVEATAAADASLSQWQSK